MIHITWKEKSSDSGTMEESHEECSRVMGASSSLMPTVQGHVIIWAWGSADDAKIHWAQTVFYTIWALLGSCLHKTYQNGKSFYI